jgi:hypothetical protein
MRVEFFIDPVSGWSWWTPASLVQDEARSDKERTEAGQRPAGQGLVLELLGRVGAWFGACEQTPSGAWRRAHASRRDAWEPGARRQHRSVSSWWC